MGQVINVYSPLGAGTELFEYNFAEVDEVGVFFEIFNYRGVIMNVI